MNKPSYGFDLNKQIWITPFGPVKAITPDRTKREFLGPGSPAKAHDWVSKYEASRQDMMRIYIYAGWSQEQIQKVVGG